MVSYGHSDCGNAGSGTDQRSRNDNGQHPTSSKGIAEWIMQPSGSRQQAKARRRAERAGEDGVGGQLPGPAQPPKSSRATFVEPVIVKDSQCVQSEEERLEGLLAHLQDFPPDDGVAELRTRYSDQLQNLRKDTSERQRDPTLQLLRAQKLTRKRERQREAANNKVAALEAQMEEVLGQLEEARTAVEAAADAIAEAKLHEESWRSSLAPATPAKADSRSNDALSETVRGLQAQVDALPAAFQSGNMEAAHAAIRQQLDIVATRLLVHHAQPSAPESTAKEEDAMREHVRDDGYAATFPENPATERREAPHAAGMRGVGPDCRSRSRSHSCESGSSNDQEGKLRRAANLPGQKGIRSWIANATARASQG